jgi:hypothetical protein
MDRSKRDPRADSEMPNLSGRAHRALDRDWTFGFGRDLSASLDYGFLHRLDSVSHGEKCSSAVSQIWPARTIVAKEGNMLKESKAFSGFSAEDTLKVKEFYARMIMGDPNARD